MIDITTIMAFSALLFSIYQQYRINKICENCPYFPPNTQLKKTTKLADC